MSFRKKTPNVAFSSKRPVWAFHFGGAHQVNGSAPQNGTPKLVAKSVGKHIAPFELKHYIWGFYETTIFGFFFMKRPFGFIYETTHHQTNKRTNENEPAICAHPVRPKHAHKVDDEPVEDGRHFRRQLVLEHRDPDVQVRDCKRQI